MNGISHHVDHNRVNFLWSMLDSEVAVNLLESGVLTYIVAQIDYYSPRGGSRPVYKVCTNLSDVFPEKFFLECFCKVQMIPDLMGSEFALQ